MEDIYLDLSADAVHALVSGTELALDLPETGLRIYLRCDDAAVKSFRQHVEGALMRLLPTDDLVH